MLTRLMNHIKSVAENQSNILEELKKKLNSPNPSLFTLQDYSDFA